MPRPLKQDPQRPIIHRREPGQRVGTTARPYDPTSLAQPGADAGGRANPDVRAFLASHSLTAAQRLVAIVQSERTSARDAVVAAKIILDMSGLRPDPSQQAAGAAADALARVAEALAPDRDRIEAEAGVDEQVEALGLEH